MGTGVFKHILIPTDGSPVSRKAVKAGIRLAKVLGACVTGYYAVELPWPAQVYDGGDARGRRLLTEYGQRATEAGKKHLAAVHRIARAAGVPYDSVLTQGVAPHLGIVNTAKKLRCDAIIMASHGRGGLTEVALGSVAHKVLIGSKIPVLVYR